MLYFASTNFASALLLVIVYLLFIVVVSVGAISAQNPLESRQEDDDGCGLVPDPTSTRWREYREPDYRDLELLKPCVKRRNKNMVYAPVSSKLDCKVRRRSSPRPDCQQVVVSK